VALINKWRKEDELFYDNTQGFTATLKMVMAKKYMTIIGGPGSGKTATARHIALQLEEQGWEFVPVYKLKDIIKYGDRDHKQVFVLDDVLGIYAIKMDHIINHQENIVTTIGETSKLLFTCRKSLYNEAFKLRLFVTENVVDLQSKDNQLTETEKMVIFQYHCKSKAVNPDLHTSISFTKANHMFPLLCKLFSMEKQYQRLGERFFNKPLDYFISELDKLLENNAIQYAVLVLCLVNGKLSVEFLPHERLQKEIFNDCGVNLGTPEKQIKDAISNMSETYFTKLDNEYTFTHDFIFEAITYHYGRQHKHQILRYLSSSCIANKVTVNGQASKEDLCIHISEDMYLPLAERLYRDIQSMNLFDVFMNKSLKHGPFRDVFEGMLTTKHFDEFESLILRKHENIHHILQKRIHKQTDITERRSLHMLFDQEWSEKSEIECSIRTISWIINYGHTHLLQEIINHVKYNNHSISLVFGSDVMENTRLLLLGCYSNTLDMVELILEYIDPKCINMDVMFCSRSSLIDFNGNHTPLMVACETGNLGIVKALLRANADINKCNCWSQSPLFIASVYGHCDVVKYLLGSGADINLHNDRGQPPLFAASEKGYCDVVKCLISSGADINLCDQLGISPLFIASMSGHSDAVKCLLSSGADINSRNNLKQPPLFAASMSGHCDVVKCLISSGADINLCDVSGQSPLFVASWKGECDVVKCLLSSGADIKLRNEDGQSPLFVASWKGECDVVKCLLSSGADINSHDEDGQSPLFVASREGKCDVVKCLLSSGAEINLCDIRGQSPLFVASRKGECDVVKCLLSSGAEINLCDKGGQSPLFIASMIGHCDVVKCLLSYDADINLCDDDGLPPLFVASMYRRYDVIDYLLSALLNVS
jgi:ankyrin repeat protein